MDDSLVHFARLMKVCRRRGRSHEEAEDLIQEAFLRLHKYCRDSQVRDQEAFPCRTVSNLAINESLLARVECRDVLGVWCGRSGNRSVFEPLGPVVKSKRTAEQRIAGGVNLCPA